VSAWDDLPEAARQLMSDFDELTIADMCADGLAAFGRIRALHHPVQYLSLTICNECSVQRSAGPGTWERIAIVPHPCNTTQAIKGEL